ncbi:hypothetical protein HDU96_006801 [Phlyctochytrium bullatum]|nr:hypothetical protein HDU96_006801 [Phlyctochytrium bullatum]
MPLRHGEIVHLPEVMASADGFNGRTLRITGCLRKFDSVSGLGLLSYDECDMLVDTTLLGVMDKHSPKSLLQMIGDMDELEDSVLPHAAAASPTATFLRDPPRHAGGRVPVLRARIVRNVDGLDTQVFEKAVAMQREFDAQRGTLFMYG